MIKDKKKFRIIAIIVAAVIALSVGAFFIIDAIIKASTVSETVRGVHERNVSTTDIDLVKNGDSEYVIVTSDDADSAVRFAVSELRQNFYESTGIDLKTKKASEVSYSENAKILSVGENALLQQAGVTLDKKELGHDGYIVQTKGSNVFMVGGSGDGTVYAVDRKSTRLNSSHA